MATINLCITPEPSSGSCLPPQIAGEEVTACLATLSHFHTSRPLGFGMGEREHHFRTRTSRSRIRDQYQLSGKISVGETHSCDAETISGSGIALSWLRRSRTASPSRDALGWICALPTNDCVVQHHFSGVTRITLVCSSPYLNPALENTDHWVHFTCDDGRLPGRIASSRRPSH